LYGPDHEYSTEELQQGVHSLKMGKIDKEIKQLKNRLSMIDQNADRATYIQLHQEILALEKVRKESKWKKTK
jgi:hypothetical protein